VEQQMSQLVTATATPLENVPGLGEGLIEKLTAAGVTTVEALADMTPEQLEAIEGIGPKTIEKISVAVSDFFSNLEAAAAAEGQPTTETAEVQEAGAEAVEPSAAEAAPSGEIAQEVSESETASPEAEQSAEEPAEEHASSEGPE
jgi:transcription termination/antitermination protein NusA